MALRKFVNVTGAVMIQTSEGLLATGEFGEFKKSIYCRVATLSGDKQQMTASVDMIDDQMGSVLDRKEYMFAPDMEGANFIAQAYEHLKTLPEFAEAEDC